MKHSLAQVDDDAEDDSAADHSSLGAKNYITASGHSRLKQELLQLLDTERPEIVQVVSWAASNGDRSENGDYLYGKKRLREIDRRIRFLTKRLETAEVVDTAQHRQSDQIFFGAHVTYLQEDGVQRRVQIVGVDEVDPLAGRISWVSPVAKALIKAHEGDTVSVATPLGRMALEIVRVSYDGSP